MRKVIAFSLWGADSKYTTGAIKNCQIAKTLFPDWKLRFYVGKTVPNSVIFSLEEYDNVEIIEKYEKNDWTAMFWRFEASYDNNADVVIFRDVDSRLGLREKDAIDEWLKSDKIFHIMRDHPYHKFPILGGMWGMKKNDKFNMSKLINEFYEKKAVNAYGTDYEFLGNILFPLIRQDSLIHDSFSIEEKNFPTPRIGLEFVGKIFLADESTIKEHEQILKRYL